MLEVVLFCLVAYLTTILAETQVVVKLVLMAN